MQSKLASARLSATLAPVQAGKDGASNVQSLQAHSLGRQAPPAAQQAATGGVAYGEQGGVDDECEAQQPAGPHELHACVGGAGLVSGNN